MSKIFKAFAPITKVDDEKRMVYGYASTDTKDSQGEIVKSEAIEAALPDYMKFANIREMHTMSAVGVAKSAEVIAGGLYLGAKIVDDAAWAKVKEGVYKGFSIGGKALEKANGIISKLRLTEISLVDRPANPECVIDTWKAESLDDENTDVAKGDEAPAAAPEQQTEKSEQPAATAADQYADITKAVASVPYEEGKPIWDAKTAMDAMGTIFYLLSSESYEATIEPGQLASLRTAIAALKDFVIAELQETTTPATVIAMADGAGDDVAKAGARYSKATKENLAKLHGMVRDCNKALDEMDYDPEAGDTGKADNAGDIAKADADVAALCKSEGIELPEGALYADVAKAALGALAKAKTRVAELEAMPAPAKAAVTTIEKSGDTKDGLNAGQGAQPDPKDPLSMFKAALARPIGMIGAPNQPAVLG